jgi:hypothetical protein
MPAFQPSWLRLLLSTGLETLRAWSCPTSFPRASMPSAPNSLSPRFRVYWVRAIASRLGVRTFDEQLSCGNITPGFCSDFNWSRRSPNRSDPSLLSGSSGPSQSSSMVSTCGGRGLASSFLVLSLIFLFSFFSLLLIFFLFSCMARLSS